ncbi:hypothetical protein ACE1TF_15900 [Geomicrobium sp. JSM 1781026]|uniref:hypothetical protein n=1 Tax=Geomicrobium sp. JSM 1781026 TaxID=3344580 RepID=UPI0035C21309
MRKADEMEKSHSHLAAIIAFNFYSLALLGMAVNSFISEGSGGAYFLILMIGMIIFFLSNMFIRHRAM